MPWPAKMRLATPSAHRAQQHQYCSASHWSRHSQHWLPASVLKFVTRSATHSPATSLSRLTPVALAAFHLPSPIRLPVCLVWLRQRVSASPACDSATRTSHQRLLRQVPVSAVYSYKPSTQPASLACLIWGSPKETCRHWAKTASLWQLAVPLKKAGRLARACKSHVLMVWSSMPKFVALFLVTQVLPIMWPVGKCLPIAPRQSLTLLSI